MKRISLATLLAGAVFLLVAGDSFAGGLIDEQPLYRMSRTEYAGFAVHKKGSLRMITVCLFNPHDTDTWHYGMTQFDMAEPSRQGPDFIMMYGTAEWNLMGNWVRIHESGVEMFEVDNNARVVGYAEYPFIGTKDELQTEILPGDVRYDEGSSTIVVNPREGSPRTFDVDGKKVWMRRWPVPSHG